MERQNTKNREENIEEEEESQRTGTMQLQELL